MTDTKYYQSKQFLRDYSDTGLITREYQSHSYPNLRIAPQTFIPIKPTTPISICFTMNDDVEYFVIDGTKYTSDWPMNKQLAWIDAQLRCINKRL